MARPRASSPGARQRRHAPARSRRASTSSSRPARPSRSSSARCSATRSPAGEREVVRLTDGQYEPAQHAARRSGAPRSSAAPGPARRCSRREGAAARERGLSDAPRLLQLAARARCWRTRRRDAPRDRPARRQDLPSALRGPRVARPASLPPKPEPVPQEWWDRDAAGRARRGHRQLGGRYHAIVVDEGQDFDAELALVARGAADRAPRTTSCTSSTTPRRRSTATTSSPASVCRLPARPQLPERPADPRPRARVRRRGAGGDRATEDGRPPGFIEADGDAGRRSRRSAPSSIGCGSTSASALGDRRPDRVDRSRTRPSGRTGPVRQRGPLERRRRRRRPEPRAGRRSSCRSSPAT